MSRSQDNWVAMGYVKGAFGIKGWVKVAADTEYADSLLDYPVWQLSKDGFPRRNRLKTGLVAGYELKLKFAYIRDRDAAQLLRGYTIEIKRSDFEHAQEGEYYWADLVGLTVYNRQNELIGTVSSLMETGAHDILVADGEHGRKLIPFVDHYIDNVDLEQGSIIADWGLDY